MTTWRLTTLLLIVPWTSLPAAEPWSVETSAAWKRACAASEGIAVKDDSLVLDGAEKGQWISKWHVSNQPVKAIKVVIEGNRVIEENFVLTPEIKAK